MITIITHALAFIVGFLAGVSFIVSSAKSVLAGKEENKKVSVDIRKYMITCTKCGFTQTDFFDRNTDDGVIALQLIRQGWTPDGEETCMCPDCSKKMTNEEGSEV